MNLFKKCLAWGTFLLLVLGGGLFLSGQCVDEVEIDGVTYDTIQDAIDAAEEYDTIKIPAGTFEEHLVIETDHITLEGCSKHNTTIEWDGDPSGIEVIKISTQANYVTIKNLQVTWTGSYSAFYAGIKVESDNNTIDNVIVGPCPRGVYLYSSEDNTVSNCIISTPYNQNHEGVTINGGSYNTVCNNFIASSSGVGGYGIVLVATSQNTIVGNDIWNNSYGIYLLSASNNYIYYNNFKNNNTQAFTFLTSPNYNQWDDGSSEGNYWDDHTCTDSDEDCVCENSYTLATGEVDRYPLCSPCNKDCTDI
jgi:parallel beta-helix repeat protein